MKPVSSAFPATRLRRLRSSPAIRALTQQTLLTPGDFIWPVFVRDGEGIVEPIASMPGVNRLSVDKVVEAAREAHALGIPAICLFPYTDASLKTEDCAEAWNPENLSNRATRAIKKAVPEIAVMTDVALDPYNITGHDGFISVLSADYVLRDGDRQLLSFGPRVTITDSNYQDAYFGIRPQDTSFGLTAFDADGGVQSVGVTIGYIQQFSPRWGFYSYAKYDRLVGDPADSPVVAAFGSRDQFAGGIALTYTFGKGIE